MQTATRLMAGKSIVKLLLEALTTGEEKITSDSLWIMNLIGSAHCSKKTKCLLEFSTKALSMGMAGK